MTTPTHASAGDPCGEGTANGSLLSTAPSSSGQSHALARVWHFYRDGFRAMTWGRVVWLILLIKLFIIFFVLRLFFFPRYLSDERAGADKGDYVSRELSRRALPPSATSATVDASDSEPTTVDKTTLK